MKKTKLVSSLDEVQSKEVVGHVQGQEFQIGPKNPNLHNSTFTTHKKGVIRKDTRNINLPHKTIVVPSNSKEPKVQTHQVVEVDDFNDHKHKFEPRIT
jgi:predicted peptidase